MIPPKSQIFKGVDLVSGISLTRTVRAPGAANVISGVRHKSETGVLSSHPRAATWPWNRRSCRGSPNPRSHRTSLGPPVCSDNLGLFVGTKECCRFGDVRLRQEEQAEHHTHEGYPC